MFFINRKAGIRIKIFRHELHELTQILLITKIELSRILPVYEFVEFLQFTLRVNLLRQFAVARVWNMC